MARLDETIERIRRERNQQPGEIKSAENKPVTPVAPVMVTVGGKPIKQAHHLTVAEKTVLVELRIISDRFVHGRTGPMLRKALTWLSQEIVKGNVDLE